MNYEWGINNLSCALVAGWPVNDLMQRLCLLFKVTERKRKKFLRSGPPSLSLLFTPPVEDECCNGGTRKWNFTSKSIVFDDSLLVLLRLEIVSGAVGRGSRLAAGRGSDWILTADPLTHGFLKIVQPANFPGPCCRQLTYIFSSMGWTSRWCVGYSERRKGEKKVNKRRRKRR